jgi:hypothetical protein
MEVVMEVVMEVAVAAAGPETAVGGPDVVTAVIGGRAFELWIGNERRECPSVQIGDGLSRASAVNAGSTLCPTHYRTPGAP